MPNLLFGLKERGADVRTEVLAGATTYVTMAYIIFVNPVILSQAGVPFAAAVTATCITAGLLTILMGVVTNYPFALAAGMGMNAFVAYTVAHALGSWQAAMAIIVMEGAIITLLVMTRIREWVMMSIPIGLKHAIGVGIGLLIALLGLKDGGLIQASPATLVTYGDLRSPVAIVTVAGLLVTAVFLTRKVRGAIILGMAFSLVLAAILKLARFGGVFQAPAWPSTFGQLDFKPLLSAGAAVTAWAFVFSSLMVDFFDTMGTVIAVGEQGKFLKPDGSLPRLRGVLLVDSIAAALGGLFGASSNTTYIESAAGVAQGGRTGLTSVVCGLLLLGSAFFVPLVKMVGGGTAGAGGAVFYPITAPALIIVGFLLMQLVKEIKFEDTIEGISAFLIVITMPLTVSISHGIGYGLITYTVLKVFTGKWRELHPLLVIVSLLFAASFWIRT